MQEDTILTQAKPFTSRGLWFLWLGWGLLNLLQATFTELFHDEAYYWMFSQQLAWGYAEHAPMVAVLIRLSSSLIDGELGVRLGAVLLNLGTMWLIYQMTDRKDPILLALLAFSMVEMQVAGFLTVPDAPLIFFVTLFLYRLQLWQRAESWANTLWVCVAIIGIVYSKYHGLMVLFFVVLSQPRLLRNPKFWFMVTVATLAYLPHLNFLVETEFATFRYHLLDRIKEPEPIAFMLNYLLGQILVAGPLMGLILFPAAFLARTGGQWEKTLRWILWGILGFLLVLSFRTRIEANWSASAFIPLLLLAYGYIKTRPNWRKWVVRLAIPSLVLMLMLRIFLVYDFVPGLRQVRKEFHYWPEWAQQLAEKAGDRPVVFFNTYQRPSKYHFYTGKPTYSLNNFGYHKTQYDLWWEMEDFLQGKEVMLVSRGPIAEADSLETLADGWVYYRFIPDFRSYNHLEIELLSSERRMVQGQETRLRVRISDPLSIVKVFKEGNVLPPYLSYYVFERGKQVEKRVLLPLEGDSLAGGIELEVPVRLSVAPGSYQLLFSLTLGNITPGVNGNLEAIEVVAQE